MRSHGLHLSVKDRRRSPQSWAKRSAGGWRRAITASLGLLALSGAAQAADYILQATVKDVDSRPLAGVQVAAGAIQNGTLKEDLQQDVAGKTEAGGKLPLKLSTDASLVGAAVVGEDPGRVHLPAEPI